MTWAALQLKRFVVQPPAQSRVSCEVRAGYLRLCQVQTQYRARSVKYTLPFVFEQDTAFFEDPPEFFVSFGVRIFGSVPSSQSS